MNLTIDGAAIDEVLKMTFIHVLVDNKLICKYNTG